MNLIAAITLALLAVPITCQSQDEAGFTSAANPVLDIRAAAPAERTRASTCTHEIVGTTGNRGWAVKLLLRGRPWGPLCNHEVLEEAIRESCHPTYEVRTPDGPPSWRWLRCDFRFELWAQKMDLEHVMKHKTVNLPTFNPYMGLKCVLDVMKCYGEQGHRVPTICCMLFLSSFSLVIRLTNESKYMGRQGH